MVWVYTSISVFIVSLISLIGVFFLGLKHEKLDKILLYLVSLSAGTLLGDAFIHLIPESYEKISNKSLPAVFILAGIMAFFVLEKIIHWRHCHKIACETHPHPFSYIILFGDAAHNLIDGMIIAAGFLINIQIGTATAIAVIFHEIPHEIGNFGSLVYGGFSKKKALFFNFLSALFAILGALLVLIINTDMIDMAEFLVPFAAGGFIYIASVDLIPELKKHVSVKQSLGQIGFFIFGIAIMFGLVLMG
jgi:zinc and cadmium transporter